MNTLNANGVSLACVSRGKGSVLIFVHGAVGDFRTWDNLVNDFSARHRTIAYSRRWHYPGSFQVNGASYTAEVHVADLLALMQNFGPAYLVGHSYGAAICAVAALHRPDLVRRLILAEPSLFSLLKPHTEGAIGLAQAMAALELILPLVRRGQNESALREYLNVILGPGGFERVPSPARAVMLDNMHTVEPMLNGMNASAPFTVKHAAQIAVPTLLVDGEQTPAPFRLAVDELAQSMPNAQRITLAGVSHGLHLENPDAFGRAVSGFLAETELAELTR